MLYRAIIGFVPITVVLLFLTGAVPISGLMPTREYRSEAVRAADPEEREKPRKERTYPEGAMAPTPQAASELFDAVDDDLEAEIKRRAPEEKARKERLRRERIRNSHGAEWAPSGGWGG